MPMSRDSNGTPALDITQSHEDRITRVEDRLQEVAEQLAEHRAEYRANNEAAGEKLDAVVNTLDRIDSKLDNHADRLRDVENKTADYGKTKSWLLEHGWKFLLAAASGAGGRHVL